MLSVLAISQADIYPFFILIRAHSCRFVDNSLLFGPSRSDPKLFVEFLGMGV
ncbi:hypothetical protein [Desulfonatronovibrio magnus]|uniref:hypothetical protein n=1 Tax=Desulfonatronovibrio magnus TaxID=698827 RepID=UPI0012FAAD43|nr:hypothetical protein [Desulfonatronovibrio magnus]